MSRKIIHNAIIVNGGEKFFGYVVVEGERIASVGRGVVPAERFADFELIDADGAYLMPGAIDTHVHFREPGLTDKGSMATESAAAVAGGVTSFLEMPNTRPATVSLEALEAKKELAADNSIANYGFFIGATNENLNELLAIDPDTIPGVKLFMGSSTGNMLVDSEKALDSLFAQYKGVIAVHAEDEMIIRRNRDHLVDELGETLPIQLHSIIRSREACVTATRRAVELAAKYGARLHLLHISTADELAMLSEKPFSEKRITAETCPHYLIFDTLSYLAERGFLIKCNPAIKTTADRQALRRAVADGLIDVIATDHAPHLYEQKQGSLLKAASGMPGVQFMLPLLFTLSDQIGLTPEKIAELTAHNPAALYAIDRRGRIEPGYYADFALVKRLPDEQYHRIKRSDVQSLCGWTPYEDMTLTHTVAATYVNGRKVWNGIEVDYTGRGMALRFNHK